MQGKLLLASPQMIDPNFAQAVVLMVQHNEEGALGLILNRPLQLTVRQACEQSLTDPCEVDDVLNQGGPCEGPLMVLHGQAIAQDAVVLPGVFFTTERSKIESIMREKTTGARYFVGYAGWTSGQLEEELEHQSWIIADAEPSLVFQAEPDLWRKLLRVRLLSQWVDPSQIPDDSSMN